MNKFDGKAVLLLHDSTNANYQQHLIAWMTKMAAADLTIIDVVGMNDIPAAVTPNGEINDAVAALADGTFDYVVVACSVTSAVGVGAVGVPNYDTLVLLWMKLKASAQGTAISTGTIVAGAGTTATHTELDHADVVTEDYYNTCLIVSDGLASGAGVQRKLVFNQAALTWICQVGGSVQTDPDGDGYEMYALENIFIATDPSLLIANAYKYWVKAVTANDALLVWDYIHSDDTDYKTGGLVNMPPLLVHNVGNWLYARIAGTMAAGSGAATLVANAAVFTMDCVGRYVYINGTTGDAGQYAEIVSHTDTILTVQNIGMIGRSGLHDAWFTNPIAASTFVVVENKEKLFADLFCQFAIKAALDNQDDGEQAWIAQQLLDSDLSMRNTNNFGRGEPPRQNLSYLGNFLDIEKGKRADQDKKDKMNLFEIGCGCYMTLLDTITIT